MRRACVILFAAAILGASATLHAQVALSITLAPPALPVYAQPLCPGPNYIWTPGYWAWGPNGYYWVPGTWVLAPYVGALWTPGWWGWGNGFYVWHAGYWGPHIGFYGGINYGFGYFGTGYQGGYWNNNAFYYNRTVNNVNVNVNKTYNTVINNTNVTRVAYNGGTGGVVARPTAQEEAFGRETHQGATQAQLNHERTSSTNRQMLASVNQGRPSIAATPRPGAFANANAVSAEGAVKRDRTVQGQGQRQAQVQGQNQGQGQGNRGQHAGQPGGAQGNQGNHRGNGNPNAAMREGQPKGQQHPQGQGGRGNAEGRPEGGGGGGEHHR
jgi:hypothetical protein